MLSSLILTALCGVWLVGSSVTALTAKTAHSHRNMILCAKDRKICSTNACTKTECPAFTNVMCIADECGCKARFFRKDPNRKKQGQEPASADVWIEMTDQCRKGKKSGKHDEVADDTEQMQDDGIEVQDFDDLFKFGGDRSKGFGGFRPSKGFKGFGDIFDDHDE